MYWNRNISTAENTVLIEMDFLKAEIERKRKQIQEKNVLQPDKKYFKRGDLAAVQEAEYLAKYGPKVEDIKGSQKFSVRVVLNSCIQS